MEASEDPGLKPTTLQRNASNFTLDEADYDIGSLESSEGPADIPALLAAPEESAEGEAAE
eukprot:CAMPEP_0206406798 /NCGR_PEP_ID=MMETSP0294-20121207/30052_1 /ASSEMBLY_ACC=CAM_ASM_000327 /TAXON_ID=39354 /ORGANISM="Heterosigma akashiwo, Strain CCMP2393" /LENGTH=59 /DNA_ID=CAMNT_0053865703 /DNA_START=87 /DNA_END=263 /DNA_ORIENTATION=+